MAIKREKAVFNKEQLIKNLNLLIKKATESRVSVLFVRNLEGAEGNGKGFQVHNQINVPADTKFFDKTATNPFHGTNLLNHLKSQEINHIVICYCWL